MIGMILGMRSMSTRILYVSILLITIVSVACGPRRNPNEKRYAIKGKVIAVNQNDHTATIQHEDIVGYMPSMTMPFKIRNDADLEMMKAGDQVTGTLAVSDVSSWVEIATIAEGTGPISPTADVPGEPKPDRKSTRLNSSHIPLPRMPSS